MEFRGFRFRCFGVFPFLGIIFLIQLFRCLRGRYRFTQTMGKCKWRNRLDVLSRHCQSSCQRCPGTGSFAHRQLSPVSCASSLDCQLNRKSALAFRQHNPRQQQPGLVQFPLKCQGLAFPFRFKCHGILFIFQSTANDFAAHPQITFSMGWHIESKPIRKMGPQSPLLWIHGTNQ